MAKLVIFAALLAPFVGYVSAQTEVEGVVLRDLPFEVLPRACTFRISSEAIDNVEIVANGSQLNLYCTTIFTIDESGTMFESLLGFNSTVDDFTCGYYWWLRFPETGQCLPGGAVTGTSCESTRLENVDEDLPTAMIQFRSVLTMDVTENLDRVTFICDRGAVSSERYNYTTLLVENTTTNEADLLPAQLITGITMGSALLCLLLVQGIVVLYSSPDF